MVRRLITAFVVVAVVAAGSVYVLSDDKPTYTITAAVEQAPNLFEQGRVMVRGVEVGEIVAVEPDVDSVQVTMEIDETVKIPADAELTIVPITVIADRYVQLYPAYSSGPTMKDGDHIDLAHTSIPAELDDVLTQLEELMGVLEPRGGRRGPLTKLVTALDEALEGRERELAGTIEGSAVVLENLADSTGDITPLIQNLDRLFAALANRSSEIGIINERFQLVAESLARDQADLEGTIENVTLLSEQGALVVQESGDQLADSFRRLRRVVDTVLAHEASLIKGMKWTNVIAQALGATDGSGRGLFAYTGRQAAPGTARAQYNYRIDTRDTVGCERLGVVAGSLLVINPGASLDELTNTALSFIPDVYDEDLRFLVELLMPVCSDFNENTLSEEAARIVRAAAREMGEDRFGRALTEWAIAGMPGANR
jgi:phospholipid/cholesterol/gamma-HCH transport system substrate-binding protein